MIETSNLEELSDFAIYKRVLKHRGDPEQIAQLVEAISGRLSMGLARAFEGLEYEFGFSVEKHSTEFDLSKADDFILFSLHTSQDQINAVICLPKTTAYTISDLMMGADPEMIADVQESPLNDIQRTLVQQFVAITEPAIQNILGIETQLKRQILSPKILKDGFDDYVHLHMHLKGGDGDKSVPFSLLLAQKAMLKVNIRQHPREKLEVPPPKMTPDKDVDLHIRGMVALSDMTLADIACLSVGDRVPLTGTGDGQVLLIANGRKLHKCRIGQNDSSYALLIEETYEPMHAIVNSNLDKRNEH